ncbi:PHP domain-containing protein [Candidatus Woesearchaeota archaeon]|nr:PHP domain-containing protein [Candidatus Woesearchaeota archaeon]MBT6518746.1 PHP domain-containing protein [Candidatus Woesearchaeota archaeon]MBT7366946.1 PHP domain-containing protein [Candidatus Woesearchaeota archaeon]
MLKTDLHIHTKEDLFDGFISHSAKDLIKFAAKKKFDVLSVTNHDGLFYNSDLVGYAKKKGILLIPGVEFTIEGKHVLVHNIDKKNFDKIIKKPTFDSLVSLKEKIGDQILITAPHPFFPGGNTLGNRLVENIKLFDAIEYSHFYFNMINFNKKASCVAARNKIPLLGTSDAHTLMQMDYTFTNLDCDKNIDSIIGVFKKNKLDKIKLITRPFPKHKIALVLGRMVLDDGFRMIRNIQRNVYK